MQPQTPDTPPNTGPIEFDESINWSHALVRSPWLWGTFITFGCYAAIPHMTMWKADVERYCCSHWVEYLEVWLFFVGLVVLVQKAFALRPEYAAFQSSALRALSTDGTAAQVQLRGELAKLADSRQDTVWARRMWASVGS